MKKKTNITGFSAIELLITLTVVSIGLVITIPAMRDFTNANRQTEQINKLVSDLNFAKSEAIKRSERITIAKTGSTAGNWYDGWQVTDSSGTVLKTSPALTVSNITLLSNVDTVSFTSRGTVTSALTFTLCDPKTDVDDVDKQITIGATGRIALDSKHDCTP